MPLPLQRRSDIHSSNASQRAKNDRFNHHLAQRSTTSESGPTGRSQGRQTYSDFLRFRRSNTLERRMAVVLPMTVKTTSSMTMLPLAHAARMDVEGKE